MRRKILGYQKVLEELKKGNCIMDAPYAKNEWMVINNELCTVRNDFFTKAYKNGLQFNEHFQNGSYTKEITLA